MTVTITYFVHGTTTDNEQNIASGWSDIGLSDLGVRQATVLKEHIRGEKFDVVFCSDLKRAVNSAHLTFGGMVQIIQDARLRECNYGTFNGKPSEVVDQLQEEMITKRFPQGESCEDVKARIADFLEFFGGVVVAIII